MKPLLVQAWYLQPGYQLEDGARILNVHHEPDRQVLVLLMDVFGQTRRETWFAEAPLPVIWRPGDPLLRRRPGAVWAALCKKLGITE